MLDLNFYMDFDGVIQDIKDQKVKTIDEAREALEGIRSGEPIVYNIETTNRCNMKCKMCPRTTMMTRSMEDIDRDTFARVVDQLKPHDAATWKKWKVYCENKYGIAETDEPSENHFFLYVISKAIQLHGYGDPLLDRHMHEYINILRERGFYSYFSCNPANIDFDLTYKMMDAGLDYVKYSIESVDDETHKNIRGQASNFTYSYESILRVLDYKEQHNLNTTLVITMLDLNRMNQQEDYDRLVEAFEGLDVYVYLKSEDCQWYRKDFHGTKSIHWSECCKHPWMTMTIKSNGDATMCMEDFNNEIVMGNVNNQSLHEIWHSKKYRDFREAHLTVRSGIKCSAECDMKLVGEFLTCS